MAIGGSFMRAAISSVRTTATPAAPRRLGCRCLLTAAMLAAVGCSPGSEDEIVFRYSGPGYKLYDRFRDLQGRGFAALHPEWDLRVKYETVSGARYQTKILVQSVARMAPDVFIVYGTRGAYNWGTRGLLLDLLPYIEKDRRKGKDPTANIYPILIDDYTIEEEVDGKRVKHLYALPGNCNVSVLYYNKDIFDEAREPYPDDTWTWDDLRRVASRLAVRDEGGRAVRFGVLGAQGLWREFLKQNEGDLWSEDKTQCLIDRPEAVETLTFLRDLARKDGSAPTPAETKQQRGQEAFMAGRAAMFMGGRWYTSFFRNKTDWRWSIAPLPKKKRRAVAIAHMSWAVSRFTQHPKIAYEFVKYMTRPDAIRYLVEIGDALPIRDTPQAKQLLLSELSSEGRPASENQTYIDAFSYTYSRTDFLHPRINFDKQSQIVSEEIERIWLGGCSVPTGLRRLKQRLEAELRRAHRT